MQSEVCAQTDHCQERPRVLCTLHDRDVTPLAGRLDANGDQIPGSGDVWDDTHEREAAARREAVAERLLLLHKLDEERADLERRVAESEAELALCAAVERGDACWIDGPDRTAWWDELHARFVAWVDRQPDEADPPTLLALPRRADRKRLTRFGRWVFYGAHCMAAEDVFTRHEIHVIALYYQQMPYLRIDQLESECDPARQWFVIEDADEVPLPGMSEAASYAYAEAYRVRMGLAQVEMIVDLDPGYPLRFVAWSAGPVAQSVVEAWCKNKNEKAGRARFEARDFWRAKGDLVHLAAPVAAPSLDSLRVQTRSTSGTTPTGIAAIDALTRLGGTSESGLVVFVAHEKNCKTLTMLQGAEHRSGTLGRIGIWVARDEGEADIQKRRWQYRGYSEADAEARVKDGLVVVDSLVITSAPLDEVLLTVVAAVKKSPVDLYLDSLNGDATGQHEIDELVRSLKGTGASVFTTAEGTAARSGPMRVKGSTGVAFAADLTVSLKYDGKGKLTLRVVRSRIARDGEVTIDVDTAGQRLGASAPSTATAEAMSEAERTRRSAVVAILKSRGPMTASELGIWIKGSKTEKAASLQALEKAGDIVKEGSKYDLPRAAEKGSESGPES